MSTLNVSNITDGTDTVETTYVISGSAKLQHRYNQSTNTVNDSINVSSTTDVSTGTYDLSYTNSFDNANYRMGGSSDNGYTVQFYTSPAPTVSSSRIITWFSAYSDRQYNSVFMDGDLA